MDVFINILIGIFMGFTSGGFGVGGAAVSIPLLYAAGLPLLSAFGINLLAIPFSSITASLDHKKNIDFKIGWKVVVGGGLGVAVGSLLTGTISTINLAIIFFIVSVLSVTGICFYRFFPKHTKKINPSAKLVIGTTFFLSFLTILRGGAGGGLFPPFLRLIGLDMRNAIATSNFATIFTAMLGAIIFGLRGNVPMVPALSVIFGAIIGAKLGSSVSLKTEPMWLEIGFSVLVIIFAFIVLNKAMGS